MVKALVLEGKGRMIHLTDIKSGFIGSSSIVGNNIPVGVGLGLAIKLKKKKIFQLYT